MDRDEFARAAVKAEEALGNIHVLVNNARVSVFGPTDEATYEDYDWIMGRFNADRGPTYGAGSQRFLCLREHVPEAAMRCGPRLWNSR